MPSRLETLRLFKKRFRGRSRKPRRPSFPFGIMQGYESELVNLVSVYRSAVERILIPSIPNLLASVDRKRPDAVRLDDIGEDVSLIIDAIQRAYGLSITTEQIQRLIHSRAIDLNRFNHLDQTKVIASIIGINPIGDEPWVQQELALFTTENVKLIQNITAQETQRLQTTVLEGIRRGTRAEDLIAEIRDTLKVTENHARLIARDQISKLNGDLTKFRQTGAGFPAFMWVTAHDARVRESHAAHDGKIYLWSDPPDDTGAPGEDYQCRCVAIPMTQEQFDEYQEAA